MHYSEELILKDQKNQMSLLNKIASSIFDTTNESVLKLQPEEAYLNNDIEGSYDLILCNLGLGVKNSSVKASSNLNIKGPDNWKKLFEILNLLSPKGSVFTVLEPVFWVGKDGKDFQKFLNDNGYFVQALFQMPTKFLKSTLLRPYIVLISKEATSKVFVVELEKGFNIEKIAKNFKEKRSENLYEGMYLNQQSFKGFERYKSEKEFNLLGKQYKQYKKVSIKDLVTEYKTKNFEKDCDSIYLRIAGNFKVVEFEEITKNRYLQLKLDVRKVNPIYLKTFLNSELGIKFLESLSNGAIIQYLQVDELLSSKLYLLPLELQNKTVEIMENIDVLNDKLKDFRERILFNPKTSSLVMLEIDKIRKSLETLTEEEKLLSLIRSGESSKVEFKQTLSKNIKTKQKDKEMEKMVLKTICGFMNTDGGTLFVGVQDSGEICGIDKELYANNNDKFLLHFKNLLKEQIGVEFFPLVNYEIKNLLDKEVLVVNCKRSDKPVFLGKEEAFFMRSNPATDELKGKELVEYIENHFKK
jgi:hypothetical protein